MIGIVAAVAASIVIGWIHAFLQHKFNMPAFIITLASLNLLYGLAGRLCGGFPIANAFPKWFTQLGTGSLFGVIPIPAVILVIVFIICFFVMTFTTTGRSVYRGRRQRGICQIKRHHVFRTKVIVFAAVQVMCVLAGMMHSAQVASGSFSFGRGWEVDVISAVVIGGTSRTAVLENPGEL